MVTATVSSQNSTTPHTYNDENSLSIICINASIENEQVKKTPKERR